LSGATVRRRHAVFRGGQRIDGIELSANVIPAHRAHRDQEAKGTMNRSAAIGIISLLATVAIALAPPTAEAAPKGSNGETVHWQVNKTAGASYSIGWGTLALASTPASGTCQFSSVGKVGAEKMSFLSLATEECGAGAGACAGKEIRITPRRFPELVVFEEGVKLAEEAFRFEIANGNFLELLFECYEGPTRVAKLVFAGTQTEAGAAGTFTPRVVNGTTATKPSEITFDINSGHLNAESEAPTEVETEPAVETKTGSATIKEAGAATWGAKVKAKCRVESVATEPTVEVKAVLNNKEIELGVGAVSGVGKAEAKVTGTVPVEFECGPTKTVSGTFTGKLKIVGFRDNATTPLLTVANTSQK
jgi:hypothetical protein